MKVILSIAGESFLIPKSTDLNKILDLFQGAKRVRHENLYGPDKARYTEPYYVTRTVADDRDEKISVALVHDDEVVNRKEWAELTAQHEQACAEFKEPEAVKG